MDHFGQVIEYVAFDLE
uniref:Uncharacterized protein n=1 Tax=Moniliophthora roreri TaxID=221103 RepID=A0A0W0FEJ4_MONRR